MGISTFSATAVVLFVKDLRLVLPAAMIQQPSYFTIGMDEFEGKKKGKIYDGCTIVQHLLG